MLAFTINSPVRELGPRRWDGIIILAESRDLRQRRTPLPARARLLPGFVFGQEEFIYVMGQLGLSWGLTGAPTQGSTVC